IAQGGAGFVIADDAEAFHTRAESGEIRRNVARAAEAFALLDEIDHGNGRLRREARGGAPKIAVEHEIAEDADAFPAKSRNQALQAGAVAVPFRSPRIRYPPALPALSSCPILPSSGPLT